MQPSISLIDESGGKRLSRTSVATLENSPFKTYVTIVAKHFSTKVEGMAQSNGTLKSCPTVELFFVYRPLVASAKSPVKAPPDLRHLKSDSVKRLDSPWVKLAVSKSPKPIVQAVFVWNERQFLFDQALMSGVRASPTKPLLPIDERVFGQYLQDYASSALQAASPEAESAAQAIISKRLPPEILWLFRHAWQSTRGPFSMEVDHALRATVERGAVGYTDLTNKLVDQLFASTKPEILYRSVLDLKNLFNLDKYRVNQLH